MTYISMTSLAVCFLFVCYSTLYIAYCHLFISRPIFIYSCCLLIGYDGIPVESMQGLDINSHPGSNSTYGPVTTNGPGGGGNESRETHHHHGGPSPHPSTNQDGGGGSSSQVVSPSSAAWYDTDL
eukprot:TRINITY_DN1041_c0_g1_i3.p1 TRINITY_DN1041_c0_g1~~TRINITY_DN1041_c0_g1_i3.p1  ORF type:complete len:125 (-),score=13.56 TRINITY_DN1041_c0_g1_i3:486-860(-)